MAARARVGSLARAGDALTSAVLALKRTSVLESVLALVALAHSVLENRREVARSTVVDVSSITGLAVAVARHFLASHGVG
mgnify:CR=1 FL=1